MHNESGKSWADAFRDLHPNADPSPELLGRVAALAALADRSSAPHRQERRRVRISAAALAVTAVCLLWFLLVWPRISFARTLRTVSFNLAAIRGYHCNVTFYYRGSRTLAVKVWYRDGLIRQDTTAPDNDDYTLNTPSANGSSVMPAVNPFAQNLRQMESILRNPTTQNLGVSTVGGRALLQVAVLAPVRPNLFGAPTPGRSVLWIDRQVMLPVRAEDQLNRDGQWVTVLRVDYDFGHTVPASLFDVPSGDRQHPTTPAELKAIGEKAGQSFARPIAVLRLGKQLVAVRSVEMNRDGDLFVLYTNGSTRKEWNKRIEVLQPTDDLGTTYAEAPGALDPYVYINNAPTRGRGLTLGNEVLQGCCYVPLHRLSPNRQPGVIHLTIDNTDENPPLPHRLTVANRRIDSLLPTYATALRQLSCSGGDPINFRRDRAEGRMMHFDNAQDWKGLLGACDAAIADGVQDDNIYIERATAYENLHQWRDAEAALEEARRQDRFGLGEQQINQLEAKLRTDRR